MEMAVSVSRRPSATMPSCRDWRRETVMSLRKCFTVLSVATLSVLGAASSVFAQSDPLECSYSECALRLKSGFFGRSLVRGAQEQEVVGLGIWVGNLDPTFEGSPAARRLAAQFRKRHNTGAALALAGLVVGVTGTLTSDDDTTRAGFVLGGTLFTLVGAMITGSGQDALHRAIWEYNAAWATGGEGAGTSPRVLGPTPSTPPR